jgi:hypothetical protein
MELAEFRAAFPGEGQLVEFKRGVSTEQAQSTSRPFFGPNSLVVARLPGVRPLAIGLPPKRSHAGRRIEDESDHVE